MDEVMKQSFLKSQDNEVADLWHMRCNFPPPFPWETLLIDPSALFC